MRGIRTRTPPPILRGFKNIFRTCAESVRDPLPYHVESKVVLESAWNPHKTPSHTTWIRSLRMREFQSKDARKHNSENSLEWGAPGLDAQPSPNQATSLVWEGVLCWVGVFSVSDLGWRNNGVCEDGEWFLREARSIRGHVGACGIEIVCAGVTIDRRRDHKRLAEERRRRGPPKKTAAPRFFWGGVVVCVPTPLRQA